MLAYLCSFAHNNIYYLSARARCASALAELSPVLGSMRAALPLLGRWAWSSLASWAALRLSGLACDLGRVWPASVLGLSWAFCGAGPRSVICCAAWPWPVSDRRSVGGSWAGPRLYQTFVLTRRRVCQSDFHGAVRVEDDFAGVRRSWRARFWGGATPLLHFFRAASYSPLNFLGPTYYRLVFPGYFYVFQIFPGRVILPAKISEKFNFR